MSNKFKKAKIKKTPKKKVIITYGTFDMFHIGHLKLLKRLSKMGDELIVAISDDAFNEGKGKNTRRGKLNVWNFIDLWR